MQTRAQRRFVIFFTLCEDVLEQRCEDWYDRIAMTRVLQNVSRIERCGTRW